VAAIRSAGRAVGLIDAQHDVRRCSLSHLFLKLLGETFHKSESFVGCQGRNASLTSFHLVAEAADEAVSFA